MVKRTLPDSSVLIAALFAAHPSHQWATQQLDEAEQGEVYVSAHSLAEVFKVLTGHPQLRMPPAEAQQALTDLLAGYHQVPLTAADYHAALTRCAEHHLSGSVIFDALIAQAALNAEAGAIVTLNPKDFRRLGADVAALVVSP
ncbi:MAG: PIN domain-containing protein [Deinococcus sp.]|uniref:type II toxin-antitoxin system VapC family toxin n=1 Tax=Deinococcus sp. TaxID=47478 RepID=UPI0026DB3B61|nr:PIN domain-containing protein [Deinococcus sp.]MDO4247227.1 PIN domain-containing protein [Deinococcus sp.]